MARHRIPISVTGIMVALLAAMLFSSLAITRSRAGSLPETGGTQYTPDVTGDSVVFVGYRMGATSAFRYDLETHALTSMESISGSSCWNPDLQGSIMVWEDSSEDEGQIRICDLSSGRKSTIPKSGVAIDAEPAVYGELLVFTRRLGLSSTIYVHNMRTGEEVPLCYSLGEQSHPDIYGTIVVYGYEDDIYVADALTGQSRPLVARPGTQDRPSICGNLVVYSDWRDGLADIRLLDLMTGQDRVIVGGPQVQYAPSIHGRIVAYEQYASDPSETRVMYARLPASQQVDLEPADYDVITVPDDNVTSQETKTPAASAQPARQFGRLGQLSPCFRTEPGLFEWSSATRSTTGPLTEPGS